MPLFGPGSGSSPLTAKGDIYTRNSTVDARRAVGTDGQYLKANSADATGLDWGSPAGSLVYRSVTTTDSPTTADDILGCSGASFDITLPTAVGNQGKVFVIEHVGTSLTQVYTLKTTSGQTIGGLASGVWKLVTAGESIRIYSNNANWIVAEHYARTSPVSPGVISVTTVSGGLVKGTTTIDAYTWWRDGRFVYINYKYDQGAGTSGTGDVLYSIPSNMTPDTSAVTASTAALATAAIAQAQLQCSGYIRTSTGPAGGQVNAAFLYNTTQFRIIAFRGLTADVIQTAGGSEYPYGQAIAFNFTVQIPITDWQP